jgi:para-aminobenzoate synthetase/4-amino-4-deoxychorismate lyase
MMHVAARQTAQAEAFAMPVHDIGGWRALDINAAPSTLPFDKVDTGNEPFVLLDDARSSGASLLYCRPVEIVTAGSLENVVQALETVRSWSRRGYHVAGYLAYEAGFAFEPRMRTLAPPSAPDDPLVWFGIFDSPIKVTLCDNDVPPDRAASVGTPAPVIDRLAYGDAVRWALELIEAGDIYQLNLTFPTTLALSGDPIAHFRQLRSAQRAGWGSIVETGSRVILSCSPELFFALKGGEIVARPMKGTAARTGSVEGDARAIATLRSSLKERAENLMIVDLLRNDLGRLAHPGSVRVPRLFDIEAYPTLFQQTSTVTATLRDGLDAIDVLSAIFPCGSITGAPKIRAMEIIAELEQAPRGIYTGSIGYIAPDGSAAFNVAIRTIDWPSGSGHARLGVGSAIVADSEASGEWRECQTKLAYVNAADRAG